jgi:hypothetical protein
MNIDRAHRLYRTCGQRIADSWNTVASEWAQPITDRNALSHHESLSPEQWKQLESEHTPEEMKAYRSAMKQLKKRFDTQTGKKV